MINIAIVEDEDTAAELLTGLVNKYSLEQKTEFAIKRFISAKEFLEDNRPNFAVVFMDIQMPGINGMDATVELRKSDKIISIIFTTNMIQYAQKGYEVDAIGFLVKPITYSDLFMKLKKALDIYVSQEQKSFDILLPDGVCTITIDKLMYVEIINHKLRYHLVGEIIEMGGSLSSKEKVLSDYGFLRCNNCYLVNPMHVVSVKGLELQVGADKINISRPKRKAFMIALTNWMARGIKR